MFKGTFDHHTLIKELSRSEFVLNPSKFESFGLCLLESLASGSTVIANNIKQYQFIKNKTKAFYLTNFSNYKQTLRCLYKARAEYKVTNLNAIKLSKEYSLSKSTRLYNKILNEIA